MHSLPSTPPSPDAQDAPPPGLPMTEVCQVGVVLRALLGVQGVVALGAAFDAGALLGAKFKTRQLRLENGAASVVRSKDGVWTLADIVLAREPDASDKPFDPIRDLNWTTLATPLRAMISAGDFEEVELANFRLNIDD